MAEGDPATSKAVLEPAEKTDRRGRLVKQKIRGRKHKYDKRSLHNMILQDLSMRLLGQPGLSANVLIARSPIIIKKNAQIFETKVLKINEIKIVVVEEIKLAIQMN